jgi:catechol 2,3-dioxygenase-like lactoylglutathione lyase family enzyme
VKLTHIRLLVADVSRSAAFYRDVLGLESIVDAGVYAELIAGDVRLGIYGRSMQAERLGTASMPAAADHQDPFMLTLDVGDVDAVYEELKSRGATFETEPHDQPEAFLRVAHLRDPDGNLIEINHSTYEG